MREMSSWPVNTLISIAAPLVVAAIFIAIVSGTFSGGDLGTALVIVVVWLGLFFAGLVFAVVAVRKKERPLPLVYIALALNLSAFLFAVHNLLSNI